jgi:hypothetical protein
VLGFISVKYSSFDVVRCKADSVIETSAKDRWLAECDAVLAVRQRFRSKALCVVETSKITNQLMRGPKVSGVISHGKLKLDGQLPGSVGNRCKSAREHR